jgi:osmotically-inducible protein OsmY
MKNHLIAATAAAVAFAFSAGAQAALTKDEYKAGKDRIAAEYKAASANCASLAANAKDICIAEAKGRQKVTRAELDAANRPGRNASYNVNVAKAEAAYAVAKERCDDKSGKEKSACVKDAKAEQTRAKTAAAAERKAVSDGKPAAVKETAAAPASKKEVVVEYVDDSVITAKVKAAVLEESSLKSAEINVETSKGRVQLSGFVRSRADINKAVEVAKRVKGVREVKNDMILKGTQ